MAAGNYQRGTLLCNFPAADPVHMNEARCMLLGPEPVQQGALTQATRNELCQLFALLLPLFPHAGNI